MIEGIIFDMDGVLVDTEHFYQSRRDAYLREMNYTRCENTDFTGSNEKAIWETIVPDNPELCRQMMLGYQEYRKYHRVPYNELVDRQAEPLFRELKSRNIRIAIASSSDRMAIDAMVRETGLEEFIDFSISGTQCGAHKPDPEIYLKALSGLGLDREHVFAVEDSSTGIAAALNAGLNVYALKPRHGENMDQSAATGVIGQLMDVLDRLG